MTEGSACQQVQSSAIVCALRSVCSYPLLKLTPLAAVKGRLLWHSVGVNISGTNAVSSARVGGPREKVAFVKLLTMIYCVASLSRNTFSYKKKLLIRFIFQQKASFNLKDRKAAKWGGQLEYKCQRTDKEKDTN